MFLLRISSALAIAVLALGASGESLARGSQSGAGAVDGLEVLTGSLQCTGSVYTDAQPPSIQTIVYLSGTSDLVSEFLPLATQAANPPASLDEMDGICASHLERALATVPSICATTAVRQETGAFANGTSSTSSFGFVCEGRRNAVIRAAAAFGRAVVLADLE